MKKLIILASLGLLHCASPLGNSYKVYISPRFTPNQTQDINAALEHWKAALDPGELSFQTIISDTCPNDSYTMCVVPDTRDNTSKMCNTTGVNGCTHHDGKTDSSSIHLALDDLHSDLALMKVSGHELGHAMGLVHDVENTLMYPFILNVTGPTCRDLNQWRSLRYKPLFNCSDQ